jgi:hypothetical protein
MPRMIIGNYSAIKYNGAQMTQMLMINADDREAAGS